MKIINTQHAPLPVGPYSQAIQSGDFLFCSGQIAINPETNEFLAGTVQEQTLLVIRNIKAVLDAAGCDFEDVVKTTCFLSDMNDFQEFNKIYAQYFVSKPARSCVQAQLPKGAKVEIEIIAFKK